ncbi:hypothetical protein H1Q63_21870 [Desmonostoc muscorum CCALA 125]|nr:hypothetical protein [Desmonostoc muscorum CCALA 125]
MISTFDNVNYPVLTVPISSALKKYEELNSVLHINQANLLQLEQKLNLADDDYQVAKNRFDASQAKKQLLTANLGVLTNRKISLDTTFINQQAGIKGTIDSIQLSLNDAIVRLNTEADFAKRGAIFGEINGYYVQIQQEQNLLSLIYGDYQQDIAIVSLKIDQVTTDLQELENSILPAQKNELDIKNQYLAEVSTSLEAIKQAVANSEKDIEDFLTDNSYLVTEDHSGKFIQDTIGQLNQKIATLQTDLATLKSDINSSGVQIEALEKQINEQQKYSDELQKYYQTVTQDEQEFQQERQIIEVTDADTNLSVISALENDSIQGYVDLSSQLGTQLKGLADVWVDNLQDNHSRTVNVWNSSQNHSQAFDSLAIYIAENLADSHGAYYLNELQLDEKIKIQESTVNRRDALAESINHIEDSIALYKKQIDEVNKLSNSLQNLQELTTYEREYADLQKSYRDLQQQEQILTSDYSQKRSIRFRKEQGLSEIQKAYNDRLATATSRNAIFNPATNSYYFLVDNATWTEAQAIAQSLGGNLVTINNAEEEAWIKNAFSSKLAPYYVGSGGDSGYNEVRPSFWIGLTDKNQEDVWQWASGEAVTYNNITIPTYYGEDYWYWHNYQEQADFASITFYGWVSQTEGEYRNIDSGDSGYTAYVDIRQSGIIELNFTSINQQLINAQQELASATNIENAAWQALQNLLPSKIHLDNAINQLTPLLINELTEEVSLLPQRYEIKSSELQTYFQERSAIPWPYNSSASATIAYLQSLRLEIAYLDIVEEKSPATITAYLQEYQATRYREEFYLEGLQDKYFPGLSNAQTLAELQQKIVDEIGNSQQEIEQLKADITKKQAEAAAALTQADAFEHQAAINWDLSKKQGATWTEQRQVKGKSGRTRTETITHVDHYWIIWDTYTKQATTLRQHAENLLKGAETDTTRQDTVTSILEQWNKANEVADEAAITQEGLLNLLTQLEAERQSNIDREAQIIEWEAILPILKEQLQQAITEAEVKTGDVQKEWTEYKDSEQDYQTDLNDVLKRHAELQTEAQQLQQEIAEAQRWVTQQNTHLGDEINQAAALLTQLQTQRDTITEQLATATGETQTNLLTKQAVLDYSIKLLTQKQTVLTAEQASLTQKQTLLNEQKKLIETEDKLFKAYLVSPGDTENLENLLLDTRAALAQAQKLADQAKASSEALKTLMDELQDTLQLQNDKYLAAIKDKQEILQELIEATELKENYTLQATVKRQELNESETKLIDILKQANEAGSQEAAKLLEVAFNNNFATAAEIYYKDYRDLANDKGGSCVKGVARPEDLQLADRYYNEMMKYRQLQEQAQQQADDFAAARQAIEAQVKLLEEQQAIAADELAKIQQSIAESEADIQAKQQQLEIAEFRISTLSQFQNWTQQTLTQLLSVEQLNLAQAKLEQEIALNREGAIDDEVKNRLERERVDIERDRQIALVTLEQLNQLKTEEALQQAINDLRFDLGLNPIEDIIRLAEWKGQLSGLLTNLTSFQEQPNLPENVKTLLIETSQDIQLAIQGKEAATIQDNLLTSANKLIEQVNYLNASVAELEKEEQQYILLLTQSETDLQGATKTLYDEIEKAGVLADEKEILTAENLEILYKVAYAQEAGQISQELAKQSQQLLNQILEKRIETRAQRKKNYINDLVGTATMVLAIAGAALTGGATLGLYSATSSLVSLGNALTFASNILSAAQSAYNGDWAKAIYSIAMTVVDYKITDLDSQLKGAEQSLKVAKDAKDLTKIADATKVLDDLKNVLQPTLNNLKTFKTVATTTYNTHRALESGDNVLAILSVFKGVADVAAIGVNIDKTTDFSNLEKVLITAGQVSVTAHEGIKLIEDGKLLEAFEKLRGVTSTISGNFASELVDKDISDGLFTLKVALTVGEVSVDVHKTIKAIEDNQWKDALKSLQKIGKTVDKNFDKDSSTNTQSGGDSSGEPSNDSSLSKLDVLVKKFEEYKEKVEQYLKDKFDLDYEKIDKLADTANVLKDIFQDDNSKAWLSGIKDILTIWEGKLKSVINENDTDKTFDVIKNLAETANLLYAANEKGKVNDWVSAIQNSVKVWQGVAYDSLYKPEVAKLAKDLKINPADIKVEADGSIYFSGGNDLKILIGFEAFRLKADEIEKLFLSEQAGALDALPDNLKAQVVNYWLQKYPSEDAWIKAHPILVADNSGNLPIEALNSQIKILQTVYYQVPQGKLTFDVEGQEGGKYHSRKPHWPGGVSGVTIGRGYDLGQQTKEQIIQDLKAAGLSEADAKTYAELQGLKGEDARKKLDELKDKLLEITPEQQQKLFDITWTKQYKEVQRISNNPDIVKAYGQVDFTKLDPAIRDLAVDLKYRGDYNSATRTKVQELMSKNDLQGLLKLMSDKDFWQNNKIKGSDGKEYNINVPEDRFKQRIQFLEKAVSSQKGAEKSKQSLNYNIGDVDPLTGIGEREVLTGYTNADLFILGNSKTSFYGQNKSDYALIKNFDPSIDIVQLHGNRDNYVLDAILDQEISGLGIYLKIGAQHELIGVLQEVGITDFDLNLQTIYLA